MHYKGWTNPPFWITYTYPWSVKLYFTMRRGEAPVTVIKEQTLLIDPRGHFTRLRCAAILTLDKLLKRIRKWFPEPFFRNGRKPLIEICEFLASYPSW